MSDQWSSALSPHVVRNLSARAAIGRAKAAARASREAAAALAAKKQAGKAPAKETPAQRLKRMRKILARMKRDGRLPPDDLVVVLRDA